MPPPIVHLNDIPEHGVELDVTLDAAWLTTALDATGYTPVGDPAGRARVRLDRQDRNVTAIGNFEVRVQAECVRCLSGVELPIKGEFTLYLEPARLSSAGSSRHSDVELDSQDLDVDVYENDRIDVGWWLREQILLEAPAYPQCPEQCARPIEAPAPAAEPSGIDPRLAPLQKLGRKE